jgi:hypothetical protein
MFVCLKCWDATEPPLAMRYLGNCEMCGNHRECMDVASGVNRVWDARDRERESRAMKPPFNAVPHKPMTAAEYTEGHPDIDYDKLHDACIYAIQQMHVAAMKDAEDAPMSAEEHRSMAYRRLRDAMRTKP